MTLKELLNDDKLRAHKTSAQELADILKVTERDLADAAIPVLSTDRRFTIAYNAILQLSTMVLYAKGYKTHGAGHHFTTFETLKLILPPEYNELINYFDSCRGKRNISDYDRAGVVSKQESDEILTEAIAFKKNILNWLRTNYPRLYPMSNIKPKE
ncbi:MAG: hypothetical protein AB1599_02805 [Planctomycetota bacterium]